MFEQLWSWIVTPFGYLMRLCYLLFLDVLHFPLPYFFAMFLFALITRVLQFPLAIRQQKQTARMSALNPKMEEIRKRYAKDRNKQAEETQKLQQEMGISMMSGCLPMLLQFPIIFIIIEVIYKPLSFMLFIPKELLASLQEMVVATGVDEKSRFIQNNIISMVKADFTKLTGMFPSNVDSLTQIKDLNMNIGSMSLLQTPQIKEPSLLWIFPIIMIVTMLIQSLFSMKASGQTGNNQPGGGKSMMIMMSIMFGFFAFSYPAGFSLYYIFTNLLMMLQSAILRKMINPEEVKAKVLAEYEARKKGNRTAKVVSVVDKKTGEVVEKKIAASELARARLQKARELDAEKYGDDDVYAVKLPEYNGNPNWGKKKR